MWEIVWYFNCQHKNNPRHPIFKVPIRGMSIQISVCRKGVYITLSSILTKLMAKTELIYTLKQNINCIDLNCDCKSQSDWQS